MTLHDDPRLWERALSTQAGRDYWRSVRELTEDPTDVAAAPELEFAAGADRSRTELGRRELMQLLGASVALAGLGACTQSPREKILPYAHRVPEVTPGVPTQYATSMSLAGFALGVLAQSNEGRPTKIEGNPEHPSSLGATSVYEQASVLDLYDPARLRAPSFKGELASWDQALRALQQGPGWRPWLILPPQSSPLVGSWIGRVRQRFPAAQLCFWSPLGRGRVYAATERVFGRALETQYDFSRARVTLSLDADFLASMPMSVRWSRDFARARRAALPSGERCRLYVLEPMLTPTGGMADHRLALRTSQIAVIAAALLREVMAQSPASAASTQALGQHLPVAQSSPHADWIRATAADLVGARGESIVIAGDQAPLELHVLAHALNAALGNLGASVWLTEPALLEPAGGRSLTELTLALKAKSADAVLILDANPVYAAPAELELERWLAEAPQTFHLSHFQNETSRACQWLLPLSHYLESWGDGRAYDGTVSFTQPLIEPLYPSRSLVEVLAACAGDGISRGHTLLTEHWRDELGAGFDAQWDELLKHGLRLGSASARVEASPDFPRAAELLRSLSEPTAKHGLELCFEASPSVYDGRFANNAWLLELPHPITKQTWGNAAVLSPRLAVNLGVATGDVVELRVQGRTLAAPVLVLPGHAEDAMTLSLGYGQTGAELLGRGVGVNAYVLRAGDASFTGGLELSLTGRRESLAITQDHSRARGRPLALLATAAEYVAHPDLTAHLRGPQPSLLPLYAPRGGPQWAMTIDTSICTGCSSCVIACQAENNVPVVGKEQVEKGREMHWLRIDRYFSGPAEAPRVVHQPMLCQHCEAAPCEYVCPVNATVHSPDGLNEMVYNRCIGTRFCSNNCPYKVRRFNFFEYTDGGSALALQRNPDVTVRERGVMEKCTYCVQRIRRSERQARIEQREILPSEVVTACQQACPTSAIQFGSLEHAGTPMVEWRKEGRAYSALHDLGTRPRTQYLAKIAHLNPELED